MCMSGARISVLQAAGKQDRDCWYCQWLVAIMTLLIGKSSLTDQNGEEGGRCTDWWGRCTHNINDSTH